METDFRRSEGHGRQDIGRGNGTVGEKAKIGANVERKEECQSGGRERERERKGDCERWRHPASGARYLELPKQRVELLSADVDGRKNAKDTTLCMK